MRKYGIHWGVDAVVLMLWETHPTLFVPLVRSQWFTGVYVRCEPWCDGPLLALLCETLHTLVEGELLPKAPVYCRVTGELKFQIDLLEDFRGFGEPSPSFALELASCVPGELVAPKWADRIGWEALCWPVAFFCFIVAVGYKLFRLRYP